MVWELVSRAGLLKPQEEGLGHSRVFCLGMGSPITLILNFYHLRFVLIFNAYNVYNNKGNTMKKSGKLSRLGLSVLLGSACVVGGTLVADAGLLHSIEHTANKAANTVVKDTNTVVNAVTNTATSSTKILQSEVSSLAN